MVTLFIMAAIPSSVMKIDKMVQSGAPVVTGFFFRADFWQWERATSSGRHQSSELNEKELSGDVGMSAGGRGMTQISAGVFVLQDTDASPHSSGGGPDLLAALQADTETGTEL